MKSKRIILCDADDTIENLCETWVAHLNSEYGTKVNSSEVVDWNVSLFFPTLTKSQVYDPIYDKNSGVILIPLMVVMMYLNKSMIKMNCIL